MKLFRFLAVFALALCLTACTKDSDDDDGDDSRGGQLAGECSLRVLNGGSCGEGQGPVAQIILTQNGRDFGLCTGTFLTPSHVLTAGHCIETFGTNGARIWSGREEVQAVNLFVHPKYDGAPSSNPEPTPYDVAILELEYPIAVETLPLLVSETAAIGDTLNIVGFGINEDNREPSVEPDLRKGTMQISAYTPGLILTTQDDSESVACPGDSGGPGILLTSGGRPAIAGVASLAGGTDPEGLGRCEGVIAALYAEVQYEEVLEWILQIAPLTETV